MGAFGAVMSDIRDLWFEYRDWLEKHAPQAFENLSPPATREALAELNGQLGGELPAALLELLALNDGQVSSSACCVLPGLELLSSQRIVREWRQWAALREKEGEAGLESLDDFCRSVDDKVLDVYTHGGWVPLFKDGSRADYLGLDRVPGEQGTVGQIINFGRDENQHFAAFGNLTDFLVFWLGEARDGRCRVIELQSQRGGAQGQWLEHHAGNSIDVLRQRLGHAP